MTVIGLQTAIWSNRLKSLLLLILFPTLIFGVFFGVFYVTGSSFKEVPPPANTQSNHPRTKKVLMSQSEYLAEIFQTTASTFVFVGPVILIWALISFMFHRQIIFAFTDAQPITRKEYPELYNIVENLCISRGLPVPNIGILEDDSLNAFATGWKPEKAWVVFSRGILNKLSKEEIEAVAAHELTHIINRDGLTMIVIIVFIGAIAGLGEILVRASMNSRGNNNSKDSGRGTIMMVGVILLVLGYIILPLVQLAISRRREYLADAGSVELTKNRDAMISALRSISQDSTIESIKKDTISALCIANPFPKAAGLMSSFHEFFSTHPTIENRIELLQKY